MESLALKRASQAFWRGKRVLLTGHTGFKGSWLTIWLHRLGARVTGLSLPPSTRPNLFSEANLETLCDSIMCDIRDLNAVDAIIERTRPEIVFHLAAQPLVRASYLEPQATFATNVMGTTNVLDAIRGITDVRVAVMITTDKVYRDDNCRRPHRENDPLGGHDPYSASKAACEIVIASYRDAFLSAEGIAVASARAGNVIGGGDWSDDRLIPDAIRAWRTGRPLSVRRPGAVRPWQHVLDPLFAYLALAQRLWQEPALAGAYNFGPGEGEAVSVRALLEIAQKAYGSGAAHFSEIEEGPHESSWLTLDSSKAQSMICSPKLPLARAVDMTMAWYRAHGKGADALTLCRSDIVSYEAMA